jgi:GNAT superfamily N-acetyltransferase
VTQVTQALRVREGGVADLPAVQRVLAAANEPYRAVLPEAAYRTYLDMVLAVEERLDVAELIVVEDATRLVGTVTFFPDARAEGWGWPAGVAGIRSMGVDPAAQRWGVGSALLDECRRRAAASGASGIVLHTAHFLPAAMRLYERHGYVRHPAHDVRATDVMSLRDPAFDFVGLAYRLDLPSGSAPTGFASRSQRPQSPQQRFLPSRTKGSWP